MKRISIFLLIAFMFVGVSTARAGLFDGLPQSPQSPDANECSPTRTPTGCTLPEVCTLLTGDSFSSMRYACVVPEGAARDEAASEGESGTQYSGGLRNPLEADDIGELIQLVVAGIVQLGVVFLVLALVYTGFLFVFAQGNEEKLRSARQALFWSIIGGVLVLGVSVISEVLKRTVDSVTS